MKGPFDIDEPKFYGFIVTRDGRWLVRYFEDGEWKYEATLYDTLEQAKEIANLLSARDMGRYQSELAARKYIQKD
jgi:hypothetical protein